MANEENKNLPERAGKTAVKRADKPSRNIFKRMAKWFREMRSELKKVIWPTPKQTANNTVIALVFMVVAAVVLWGFDTVAQAAVNALISIAG